ncbi:AbiU2 domain-containing protein [Mariniplasma anaerobium]|uniref:HEPN AbiU2-like domain-containing protein n=1 Tax=Mariniplasma anaerobium TaxID=2735436 RepID=A0A7U9TI13_9MOLU|nr:hypothetical protein [Mariniplasma anaerobium]BCR36126.1 hypothetical protein MPAN_010190 [Mariniplasma anaerobium]
MKNKSNLNTEVKITNQDIDNFLKNVFTYQISMLAEATIGFLIQNILNRYSSKTENYAVYHSQIYFEHLHITLYKLLLDNSGKSSLNIQKLFRLILDNNYKPELADGVKKTRIEFNKNILGKYNKILEHVRKFRNKLNAHIVTVPITEKPKLKDDSIDLANDLIPLVQDTVKYYIELLEIFGFKHTLNEYLDIDFLVKDRINKLIGSR